MPTIIDSTKLEFHGSWIAPEPAPDDTLGTRLHAAWIASGAALDGLQEATAKVRLDETLSELGKIQRLAALGADFLTRLDGPAASLAAGEAEVTRLSTQLESEGRAAIADAIKLPRAIFLLGWWGGLDRESQTLALEIAIHSKDKETLGAILTAPATWLEIQAPWFTLQQRGRVETAFQTQSNPMVVLRRDGLKAAVGCLTFAIEHVGQKIRSETGTASNSEDAMRARLIAAARA